MIKSEGRKYTKFTKKIGQPNQEDQEKRYRGEQEKYGQEYKKSYESQKQMKLEGEEKKDISQIMSETYKEFYVEWVKILQNSFGKTFQIPTLESNKETFENITGTPDLYSEAFEQISKMYGNAFDNFFDNTPTLRPFKEIMEPVRNAAKLYTDMFTLP